MARPKREQDLNQLSTEIVTKTPDEIAVNETEMRNEIEAVNRDFGLGIPWNMSVYEQEIVRHYNIGLEAFAKTGALLIVARANTAHGEWSALLNRLDISHSDASRAMAFARKTAQYLREDRQRLFDSVRSKGKAFELLTLPNDQLEELVVEGRTGDIELDEIETMTRAELRQKVRELNQDLLAKDKLLKGASTKIRSAGMKIEKLDRMFREATPDERVTKLRNAITDCSGLIKASIESFESDPKQSPVNSLKTHMLALVNFEDPDGVTSDHRAFLAGVIDDLIHTLKVLRDQPELDLQQVKARKH